MAETNQIHVALGKGPYTLGRGSKVCAWCEAKLSHCPAAPLRGNGTGHLHVCEGTLMF